MSHTHHSKHRLLFLVLSLALGCGDDDDGTDTGSPAQTCVIGTAPVCRGSAQIDQCEDGTPLTYTCQQVCLSAGLGAEIGCITVEADMRDVCTCSDGPALPPGVPASGADGDAGDDNTPTTLPDLPESCSPDARSCDGDVLSICSDGNLSQITCDDTWCATAGFGASLQCGTNAADEPACLCEGMSLCPEGAHTCADGDAIRTCQEGHWGPPADCRDECELAGYDTSLGCWERDGRAACDCHVACNPKSDTTTCIGDPALRLTCTPAGHWEVMTCENVCEQQDAHDLGCDDDTNDCHCG